MLFSRCYLCVQLATFSVSFGGLQGAQVKLFAKELQLSGRFPNLSYVYWDERLTSVVFFFNLSCMKKIKFNCNCSLKIMA